MRKLALETCVLLACVAIWPSEANALVMCAKIDKSGAIKEGLPAKLRASCKDNEEEISGGGAPTASDASGQSIGRVVSVRTQCCGKPTAADVALMSTDVSGHRPLVLATVSGDGFDAQAADLMYESSDCSGAPFIPVLQLSTIAVFAAVIGPVLNGQVAGPGTTAYFPTGSPVSFAAGSSLTAGTAAGCTGSTRTFQPPFSCCQELIGQPVFDVYYHVESLDLGGLQVPFKVEAN